MTDKINIALVDDDAAVLDSLALYLAGQGVTTACFECVEKLIAALDGGARPDCIVSDIRLPGLSGLDLLDHLKSRPCTAPLILITAVGDIEMAVAAMKTGAFDFIEKPFDEARLRTAIEKAVALRRRHAARDAELEQLRARFNALSARQRQVMGLAAAGLSNKEIAFRLDISPKTVENHRAWVMERMDARSLADLVRSAMRIEEQC